MDEELETMTGTDDQIQAATLEMERLAHEGADFERTTLLEVVARAAGDTEDDGTFPGTIATNGEALDGHILSIPGIQINETGRMPLLLGHQSTVQIPSLGHVDGFKRSRGTPARMRGTHHINLTGDTAMTEVRRGVLELIRAGDLPALSFRGQATKATPRIELAKTHPAYIDPQRGEFPQRYGMLFEKTLGQETSVVAVGSDATALIGRAAELGPDIEKLIRGLDLPGYVTDAELLERTLFEAVAAIRDAGLAEPELAALLARAASPEAASTDLVRYPYLHGDTVREHFIPRAVHDALTGESRGMLATVLDAIERKSERMSPPTPPKAIPAPAIQRPQRVEPQAARTVGDLTGPEFAALIASALEPLAAGRIRR